MKLRGFLVADRTYNDDTAQVSAAADAAFSYAVWMIGFGAALAAVLAVTPAVWLNRQIVTPLLRAIHTRQLAQRDYAFDLPSSKRTDEIGDLSRALGECRDGLRVPMPW